VVAFASLSGDWNSIHTDAEYARQAPFGSGWPTGCWAVDRQRAGDAAGVHGRDGARPFGSWASGSLACRSI